MSFLMLELMTYMHCACFHFIYSTACDLNVHGVLFVTNKFTQLISISGWCLVCTGCVFQFFVRKTLP